MNPISPYFPRSKSVELFQNPFARFMALGLVVPPCSESVTFSPACPDAYKDSSDPLSKYRRYDVSLCSLVKSECLLLLVSQLYT
jgi:hypothetical protein